MQRRGFHILATICFEENDQFKISSADTSRVYQVAFNFDTQSYRT